MRLERAVAPLSVSARVSLVVRLQSLCPSTGSQVGSSSQSHSREQQPERLGVHSNQPRRDRKLREQNRELSEPAVVLIALFLHPAGLGMRLYLALAVLMLALATCTGESASSSVARAGRRACS